MTDHVARLYTLVAGVLVFFVFWAVVAAHPWGTASTSSVTPSAAKALVVRERQLALESRQVKLIVDRRWAAYRAALHARTTTTAAAARASVASAVPVSNPTVRVVQLPPLVVTRTS